MTIGQREVCRGGPRRRPSAAEAEFLDLQLVRLRQLESRSRGLFAEALVAHHLGGGAHGSSYAASPWDLCWEGRTIAVRATGQYNSETVLPGDGTPPVVSKLRWQFDRTRAFTAAGTRTAQKLGVWTDVLILAVHRGEVIDDGWTFLVIDGRVIDQQNINSFGVAAACDYAQPRRELPGDELAAAVAVIEPQQRRPGSVYPVRCDDQVAHDAASKP